MSSANTAAGFISSTGFSSQCFPVRSLTSYKRLDDDGTFCFIFNQKRMLSYMCSGIYCCFSFVKGD